LIYKYLKKEDCKKIENYCKAMKSVSNGFRWLVFMIIIFICFTVGLFCFYINMNKDDGKNQSDNKMADSKAELVYEYTNEFEESEINENQNKEKNSGENPVAASLKEKNSGENPIAASLRDFSDWNKTAPEELKIVNSGNSLENFIPELKLVGGKRIHVKAAENLEKMMETARKEDIKIWIASAYRNVDHQRKLFESRVSFELEQGSRTKEEAKRKAKMNVAEPWQSEHNLGLAVDFNNISGDFQSSSAYKWLSEKAADFGFIERYKKEWQKETGVNSEPWHWRYVGVNSAKIIKKSGKSLEKCVALGILNSQRSNFN
jgi:D-alanyl-D-alanine carboxypeptidase